MLILGTILFFSARLQSEELQTRIAASGKNVYVVSDLASGRTRVRRFVETTSGMEPVGKPRVLKYPISGIGPGRDGSLLLLDKSYNRQKVVRVMRDAVRKVCDVPIRSWIDPDDTLSEMSDFLVLQSRGGDETPTVMVSLYRKSWIGPVVNDGGEYKTPVNADRMVWATGGTTGWTICTHESADRAPLHYWQLSTSFLAAPGDRAQRVYPVASLAKDTIPLLVNGKLKSWFAILQGQTLHVFQPIGKSALDDPYFMGPLVCDKHGRLWTVDTAKGLKRIQLKVAGTHAL